MWGKGRSHGRGVGTMIHLLLFDVFLCVGVAFVYMGGLACISWE